METLIKNISNGLISIPGVPSLAKSSEAISVNASVGKEERRWVRRSALCWA